MPKKILLLALPLLSSCSSRLPIVRLIVPAHYVGPITILFDQPDGHDLDQKDDVTTFRFPRSGTLLIRQSLDQVPNSFAPESFDDSGKPLSIGADLNVPRNRSPIEKATRMAYLATAVNNNKWVGFAGSLDQLDAYEAKEDRKSK